MATKAKKSPAKKTPAKKPAARSASARRQPFITRSNEYTQLTWVLIGIWLVLIAIFLGTVIKQVN